MKKILLLGSGELGKEFVISAQRKGQHIIACDSYAGAPAMQVADEFEVFDMLNGEELERVVKKTINCFCHNDISKIIVAYNANDKATVESIVRGRDNIILCEGGASRSQSISNALKCVEEDCDRSEEHTSELQSQR